MHIRLTRLVLLLLLSLGGCSCWHDCPPKHLFSFIDRNCFVADWMNDHSCTSCRYCANNCPPTVVTSRVYTADTDAVPSASK
jgi:heterodisulfide reductase subunit A-like polyferredoxin